MHLATFFSRDLWAGAGALAWASMCMQRPDLNLDAIVSQEAAAAFAVVALGFWYGGHRNGVKRK